MPREVYRNDEIIRYVMPAFMGISFENINAWIRKESTSFREGKEHTALWRTMCNLKIIKQYDIRFNQSLSVGEDTLFTNEYLWRCKSVGVLDKTLYYLVQRDGSANDVNNKSEELMYTNKIKIINAKEQLASKIQAESGIDIRSYWQGNNVLSALQIAFAYAKSNRGGLKERYKKFCTFYCEKHIRESINTFKYAAGMRAIPFFLLKHMKTTVFIAGVLLPRKIVSRFI